MSRNMVLKLGKSFRSIPVDGIVFMEKDMRKIRIHTKEEDVLEFYAKFSEIMPYLDKRFMHCHRSYIINMDEILLMECRQIHVSSNECISLGRDTYSRARKKYSEYMSGGGQP